MLSKKQGRSYVIQDYEDTEPFKLNKKKTDAALKTLRWSLLKLSALVSDTYNNDPELFWFINDHIWLPDSYNYTDYTISDILTNTWSSVKDLDEFLKTHNDDIRPREEIVCLEDLGFKDMFFYDKPDEIHVFERLKDIDGDKEIMEEVVLNNGEPYRRFRTTIWEKTEYGRSSRSIRYRKLNMTKQLKLAATNTLQHLQSKKKS